MAAKKTIAIGFFIAGVAFLLGRQQGLQSTVQVRDESPAAIESGTSSIGETAGLATPVSRSAAPRPRIDPALRAQLFEEYRCPQAACDLSPFIAENENEAIWLRQRGYPSPQQREQAKTLPTSELKLRADRGDLVHLSLYGERLMEEGQWERAYGVLSVAATRGSLYSLYALAQASTNDPKNANAIEARSFLRLAYLAGDYKAQLQLIKTFPQFNGTSDDLLTDEVAAHRFRKLLRYRMYPRPPTKE